MRVRSTVPVVLSLALAAALGAVACSAGGGLDLGTPEGGTLDFPPSPDVPPLGDFPVADGGGGGLDVFPPDMATSDVPVPPPDQGPDARPDPDMRPPPDVPPDGSQIECPPCGEGELCVTRGPTNRVCLIALPLFDDTLLNFALLAIAHNECWRYQKAVGGGDTLCYALDTTQAPEGISNSAYDDWVCNTATAADFGEDGETELALARDLSGCDLTDLDMTDFQIDPIPPGRLGELCMAFDDFLGDELHVDNCTSYATFPVP